MKTAAVFLAGVIIGVGTMAVLSGQMGGAPSPPPDTLPPPPTTLALPAAMCEGLVRLSLQGGAIVADPDPVCLAVGRPLTWEIVDKGTVTITFEEVGGKKGPFPETGNSMGPIINKYRGIYEAKNDNTITGSLKLKSLGADNLPRPWKYTIEWTPPGSTDPPIKLDPVVCIRR